MDEQTTDDGRRTTGNIPLDATSIYFTFQAMQEVMRPGEEGLWQQFISSTKIAWKTGTILAFVMAGPLVLQPKNVVGRWVGNTGWRRKARISWCTDRSAHHV